MIAAGEHALSRRPAAIEPGLADRVDRADVVLVAVLDARADGQVDAERRAEERRLDVVGGERVAGEQHVDEAGVDQRDHRRRRAGVHDAGPADPQDPLAGGLHLAHPVGDLAHQQRLRLLAGDLRLHELEDAVRRRRSRAAASSPGRRSRRRRWHRRLDVGHRHGADPRRRGRSTTTSPQSISGFCDRHPVAAEADLGLQVGGRVEVVGEHAVLGRLGRSPPRPGRPWLTPWVCSRISSRCRLSSSSAPTSIRRTTRRPARGRGRPAR